jgi:hypothetical protein
LCGSQLHNDEYEYRGGNATADGYGEEEVCEEELGGEV